MIHRNSTMEKQPEPIKRDSRGTEIAEGLRVAFNRSGDVAIGKIVRVVKNSWKCSTWRWHLTFEIHIEGEDGRISKVKNPNSFIII